MSRTIGQAHAEKILSLLRNGDRMLHWGAAADAAWFAGRLPAGATLVSVGHEPSSYHAHLSTFDTSSSVRLLLRPPDGPTAGTGTRDDEDETFLTDYIHAADERFDVIAIDGVARGACLAAARRLLNPDGVICLHDSQQPRYDEAKTALACWGVVGPCSDGDPAQLWIGGMRETPRTSVSGTERELPLIVSSRGKSAGGTDQWRETMASCHRLGLACEIVDDSVDDAEGGTEQTPRNRAEACLIAWRRHHRPILWVAPGATIQSVPSLLSDRPVDVACHRRAGWQISGATLYFNHTKLAGHFLEEWVACCRREPGLTDAVALDLTWESLIATAPLDCGWLPREYCQFAGSSTGGTAVIVHAEAGSPAIGGRAFPHPTEALHRARLASRPRARLTAGSHAGDIDADVYAEQLLSSVLPGRVPFGPAATPASAHDDGWWLNAYFTGDSRLDAERLLVETIVREIDAEVLQCREMIYEASLADFVDRLPVDDSTPFAIYGSGQVGQAIWRLAQRRGLTPRCFVESDPATHGDTILGLPIVSVATCREMACDRYAIGSYASADAMLATVRAAYETAAAPPELWTPPGPGPRLPEVRSAAKTLLAVRNGLMSGRLLADWQTRETGSTGARDGSV
jgi:hypothetical protein